MFAGEGQLLIGEGAADDQSFKNLSTIGDVERRREKEQVARFAQWKAHSKELRMDSRLVAYYPIAASKFERFVPNATDLGSGLDGKVIGQVNHSTGRFGVDSNSLGFDRPGARVRARVDGEFAAFTFVCWVKIDSLAHRYNSLFMGDGYENGEPHWQIQEDGRIMFSVMVDDTPGAGSGKAPGARSHHIYYTDSVWDASLSGKWIQLAAVYGPVGRQVRQYVDGRQVSNEEIRDRFLV